MRDERRFAPRKSSSAGRKARRLASRSGIENKAHNVVLWLIHCCGISGELPKIDVAGMRRSLPLWCSVCADLIHLRSAKWHRINRAADWLTECKTSASGKSQLSDPLPQRTATEHDAAKFAGAEEQPEVKSRPRRDKRWGIPGLNAESRSTS
jgi:hypothetical protein